MADPHHADAHDDYVRGSQEISEQVDTFALVMGLAKWGSLLIATLLLLLVMWFQPGGSFIAGAIAAVVVLAVGIFALRKKKTGH